MEQVLESPMVADPLRLFEICATSDGAAAVVISSMEYARKMNVDPVKIAAVSTVTPTYPQTTIEMPYISTDSAAVVPAPVRDFKDSIAYAAYEEAGSFVLQRCNSRRRRRSKTPWRRSSAASMTKSISCRTSKTPKASTTSRPLVSWFRD